MWFVVYVALVVIPPQPAPSFHTYAQAGDLKTCLDTVKALSRHDPDRKRGYYRCIKVEK